MLAADLVRTAGNLHSSTHFSLKSHSAVHWQPLLFVVVTDGAGEAAIVRVAATTTMTAGCSPADSADFGELRSKLRET